MLSTIGDIIEAREERGDKSLFDSRELPMLKNLFQLRDVRVKAIMTPRVKIDAVPLDMKPSAFCKHVAAEQFTRYPVYDGVLDNVVGVVHVKDILACVISKRKCFVQQVMTPNLVFVSPMMRALDLLKEMQSRQLQMAIVIDEHGGVDGLVSLEDLLEVVVGEIEDEHDTPEEGEIKRLNDNTVEVNANLPLDKFERMVCRLQDVSDRKDAETIGGFVTHLSGHVPQKGEVVIHKSSGVHFLILKSIGGAVKMLKVSHLPVKKMSASTVAKRSCKK